MGRRRKGQSLWITIANSNIVDLINDTVRGRKKSEPSGWQTFAQNLKESNVPRDYMGNKKRWEYMHEEEDEEGEEEGELFGTPRQNIAMRIKESVKTNNEIVIRLILRS